MHVPGRSPRYTLSANFHRKSDVRNAFQKLLIIMMSNFNDSVSIVQSRRITEIHSDGGNDYKKLETEFGGMCGIKNPFFPRYNLEIYGIAELVKRALIEAARALLIQTNLPKSLWAFALKHMVSIQNRVPHSAVRSTPFEAFHDEQPSLKHVQVFGCSM